MDNLIDKFEMKANFEGLIKLLAKNLYSEPNIFIRELIQNSHDSIVRRQIEEKNHAGFIDIFTNKAENKIVFTDNGIGMDEADIKNFLSVIGSTGTGTVRDSQVEKGLDFNLIGQFGIGMLSAFVVASKVIVRTKKAGSDKSFAWHNAGSMECLLYEDNKENTGTEIHIFINSDYKFVLSEDFIIESIKKYCDFIQFPINLNQRGTINIQNAPWHKTSVKTAEEKIQEYRQFLHRRFHDLALHIIPVEINDIYKCKGVLFISDAILPDISASGIVDIFVRRMFVRNDDKEILPQWAKFIRGIIDSPDLKPTAARDNVQRNEAAYHFIQAKLGDIIIEELIKIANTDPNKFKKINKLHHYHLKGMAAAHHQFFEKICDYLLFDTNLGQISLHEVVEKSEITDAEDGRKPIYYFTSNASATQFFSIADAKKWVIINASSIFEEPLLKKYAYIKQEEVRLERIDTTDDPNVFGRLNENEEEYFRLLELEMESILKNMGIAKVVVRTRKFEPASLPSVLITTAETDAELKLRKLMNDAELMGFDDIAMEAYNTGFKKPVYLSLNANNPVIRQLSKTESYKKMKPEMRSIVTKAIYNSTLLYSSQDFFETQDVKAIHKDFVQMIDFIVNELNK